MLLPQASMLGLSPARASNRQPRGHTHFRFFRLTISITCPLAPPGPLNASYDGTGVKNQPPRGQKTFFRPLTATGRRLDGTWRSSI